MSAGNAYEYMVAGRAPATERDAERVVFFMASSACDDDAIHVLWHFHAGEVRYIALPARIAASGVVSTPLVCALPGTPRHKGWGIYRLSLPMTTAIVICTATQFEMIHHDPEAVDEALSQWPELEIHDVLEADIHGDLQPARVGARREMRRALAQVVRANVLAVSGAAILLTVSMAVNGWMTRSTHQTTSSVRGALSKIVDDLASQSKATEQLEELIRVGATVSRAGGWIREYHYKEGESSFLVVMPEWVTNDYVERLGRGVTAEIDHARGLIEYRKGKANGAR